MAIRILRHNNTYDAKNNRLTSQCLFLRYSNFSFCIMDLRSRFMEFPLLKNPIPQRIVHRTTINILRNIFPSIIPMFIDKVVVETTITIRAIGHQWYWSMTPHECSEICGTNHAFMPIIVEAVPRKDYGSRVSNQLIPQSQINIQYLSALP
uniref:Cytochrome c oxidase polypeptide II n=1 Tax=Solanum lycopersicum TaxID=4081 RepID=A0A3Q7EXT1_SOLLC